MNWLRRLGNRKRLERQLQAELSFHLERQITDNLGSGMSQAEAARQARLKFGGLDQIAEDCRDARGTRWLESTFQDLRYALRILSQSPGFLLAAVGTLALGIGANTAIFQLLDAVRLRSLPISDPHQLAEVRIVGAIGFGVLGVPPWRGRLILPEDEAAACTVPRAVVSYSYWQREMGAPNIDGTARLTVGGRLTEVIGVTPPAFLGLVVGSRFDIALPLCQPKEQRRELFNVSVMDACGPAGPLLALPPSWLPLAAGSWKRRPPPATVPKSLKNSS